VEAELPWLKEILRNAVSSILRDNVPLVTEQQHEVDGKGAAAYQKQELG